MRDLKQLFKGQQTGNINVDFVIDENEPFALEIINNSTGALTLSMYASLQVPVLKYSQVIDPSTEAIVSITVPSATRQIRSYDKGAFPAHCRLVGTLAAGTVDTEIWIAK